LQEVLDQILLTFVSFLHSNVVGCARRLSGRGSGGSMSSSITPTIHNPVT
jgi:hypothetical protein